MSKICGLMHFYIFDFFNTGFSFVKLEEENSLLFFHNSYSIWHIENDYNIILAFIVDTWTVKNSTFLASDFSLSNSLNSLTTVIADKCTCSVPLDILCIINLGLKFFVLSSNWCHFGRKNGNLDVKFLIQPECYTCGTPTVKLALLPHWIQRYWKGCTATI